MGKYNGVVITAAGQNLIAQAIAQAQTVTFTTAQVSTHVYPAGTNLEALTSLDDVQKTVDITYAGVYSDTVIQVSARFDNAGVESAYLINTMGFFAQIGTNTPILFAVSTAVTPDQMPVYDSDNPSAFIYNMQATVQNARSIYMSVNPTGTITVDQFDKALRSINGKIEKAKALVINVPLFSSLPVTISNSEIDDDMIAVNMYLSNPGVQTGEWTVTTSSESLTINGNISGSTTATIYLEKPIDSGGESSGTTPSVPDYLRLSNKPSINGVTLVGDKALDTLGIQPENEDLDSEMSNTEIDELLNNSP